MNCQHCGHWHRCPACQGWVCEVCGAELAPPCEPTEALLAVCQEIAGDPQVDLLFVELRPAA